MSEEDIKFRLLMKSAGAQLAERAMYPESDPATLLEQARQHIELLVAALKDTQRKEAVAA